MMQISNMTFTEGQVWALVELFGYLELATLAELTGMPTLLQFELKPWGNLSLGEDNKGTSTMQV